MFRGFNCDSITVPSCINHNCTKGGADQAIVSALLTSIKNYAESNAKYKARMGVDLTKAIKMARSTFERTKNKVISKPFFDDMPDAKKHLPDIGFLKTPIKVSNWIKNLTAAIFYDGIQSYDPLVEWDKIESWSPDYIDSKLVSTAEDKILLIIQYDKFRNWLETKHWINGWSAYPRKYPQNIYCFFFSFDFDDITIKHRFYNNYNWYASFKPSPKTKEMLLKKLNV